MTEYTKRTCYNCGIRKPQPQMYRKEIMATAGKSSKSVGGMTLFGFLFGSKKSANAIGTWLSGSANRKYKRKKTVWLCGNCK